MKDVEFILLVDDDDDDRFLFAEAVRDIDKNIICACASGAEEGLQLLKRSDQLPDLIFLDLNMPRINGKQCLREIKKIKKLQSVPVIIYSTAKPQQEENEALELGASLFMVKPSSYEKLKQELAELIFDGVDAYNTQDARHKS